MTAPSAIEAVEITDAGACRMHKFPTEISTQRNLKCRLGLGAFVTPRVAGFAKGLQAQTCGFCQTALKSACSAAMLMLP